MKKVLLGLLALSAVSMAAEPNLLATPTAGTPVFQTGQEGAIAIEGKLTATVPTIKYVVYASKDGGVTKEDKLVLADFVMSQKEIEAKYTGENPKLYVKRIVPALGGVETGELNPVDIVSFKMSGLTGSAWDTQNQWLNTVGANNNFLPEAMLSRATLEEIITAIGDSNYHISNDWGGIELKDYSKAYRIPNIPEIKVTEKGVLEIGKVKNKDFDKPTTLTDATVLSKIEAALAGGKATNPDLKILIKVD
ncbi:hypothetical protein [Cetobacterium sp.]|uniref:hypothetical protein n=1 Tax=Cetobacterium sp. TaxID=2071632 RepID=UPI003F3C518D